MAIDLPDDLIELERTAWAEIQAGTLTVETALAVQAGISALATRTDVEASRLDIEMTLKRLVRHPSPEASQAG